MMGVDGGVLSAAFEGLALVLSWPWILYPVAGTLLAMAFSASPGLNSSSLMALALPVTYAWDPLAVMLLFGAFVGGATFMGSVTAILFNIPGKTQNMVTLLDGYPMTRAGRSRTAIGCAAAASALGSTFGVGVLLVLIPVLREAALAMGPAEVLALGLWGLSLLAALCGPSLLRGLTAAAIGVGLALMGLDPRSGEPRFTLGLEYLQDGISLVPAFLGLFALAEVLDLAASGRRTLSGRARGAALGGSAWAGVAAVFSHFGLFLRSSLIGTVIGAIPGIGSSVAGFVAYGHARQSAGRRAGHGGGDSERFGHGDVRGVLAPEAANDAKDGGALIPTLALGIPGGTGTTVLIGALSLHGLTPGRELMTEHLALVFVLIWSLFLSNWITSLLGLALVNPLARMGELRTDRVVPVILVLAVLGCLQFRGLYADLALAFGFALLGYAMKRLDWPRVPLVIGLTLGPLLETNLHLVVQLQSLDRIDFWSRPVVLVIGCLILANLVLPLLAPVRDWSRKRRERKRGLTRAVRVAVAERDRESGPATQQEGHLEPTDTGWLGALLLGALALVALSWALGLIAGGGLFLAGWLRFVGSRGWAASALGGALLAAGLWLLFPVLLSTPLVAGRWWF